jgi:hypothetical protein
MRSSDTLAGRPGRACEDRTREVEQRDEQDDVYRLEIAETALQLVQKGHLRLGYKRDLNVPEPKEELACSFGFSPACWTQLHNGQEAAIER